MEGGPPREFGKRVPAAVKPTVPAKRSRHVALLLMGTFAVGGGAYALMPSESCQPPSPGAAMPSAGPVGGCTSRGTSSGAGGRGYAARSGFFGSDSSSRPAADSSAGSVTRGGFGSFARAFTAHFSGGG